MATPLEPTAASSLPSFAVFFCVETAACESYAKPFEQQAISMGATEVFRTKMSLAQPDFTAECLSARNARAEAVLLVMDTNSVGRVAASCGRQNYRPVFILMYAATADRFRDDPNLEGAIVPTPLFPWFKAYSAASAEFHEALKALGGEDAASGQLASGWTAGKLLELAGSSLSEPPTSESLLRGLWSIKNHDLAGLTMPLTFEEDKPAKRLACWFNVRLIKGAWTSPDGFQRRCL